MYINSCDDYFFGNDIVLYLNRDDKSRLENGLGIKITLDAQQFAKLLYPNFLSRCSSLITYANAEQYLDGNVAMALTKVDISFPVKYNENAYTFKVDKISAEQE